MADTYNDTATIDLTDDVASQDAKGYKRKRKRNREGRISGDGQGQGKHKKAKRREPMDNAARKVAPDSTTRADSNTTNDVMGTSDTATSNSERRLMDPLDRATELSKFQEQIVLKAMTFPAVQKVSYSTCSIYEIENEQVVARVLEKRPEFEVIHVLPAWPRRGIKPEIYPFADKVLRADRKLDGTTGFFVALFSRKVTASSAVVADKGTDQIKVKKNKKKKRKKRRKKKVDNPGVEDTMTTMAAGITEACSDDDAGGESGNESA